MANGSFTGSKYGQNSNYYLSVSYSSTTNTTNNNSALTVAVVLYRSWLYIGSRPGYIYVTYTDDNGASHTLTYEKTIAAVSESTNKNYQIMSATFTVPHKSDGTQSVTIKADYNTKDLSLTNYGTVAHIEASKSGIALDTIPRKGTITSITGNTIGSKITVAIKKASTSYTHKLIYQKTDGTQVTKSENVTETSYSFTPDMSDCSLLPSAESGTSKIILQTWSGTTKIGEDSKEFTIYVPASVAPTVDSVSVDLVNDNEVVNGWDIWLKGYSKAKVSASVTTAYGSTIKSYAITGGGFTGKVATYTTGLLKSAGSLVFNYKVVDGRGRPASKSSDAVTVVDYYTPLMSSPPQWYRCTEDGTASGAGQYLRVLVNADFASCSGNNSVTVTMQYKKKSETAYQSLGTLANHEWNIVGANDILSSSSYDIKIVATDALGETSTYDDIVPTETVTLNLKKGGKGARVGGVAEEDGVFAIDWLLRAAGILGDLTMQDGVIHAKSDAFIFASGGVGLDMNNSDVSGLNCLVFGDECSKGEGFFFPKTGCAGSVAQADYDELRALDGTLYFNQKAVPAQDKGTWTPVFVGATCTYTTQTGYYARVGCLVWLYGLITISAYKSMPNALAVGGFPYAALSGVDTIITCGVRPTTVSQYVGTQRGNGKSMFYPCKIDTSTGNMTYIWPAECTLPLTVEFSGVYRVS